MNSRIFLCHNTDVRHQVKQVWQMEGHPAYAKEAILPKGVTELIFSFADNIRFSYDSNHPLQQAPRCFINGINSRPVYLGIPSHQCFFGVVLHAHAVKKLLSVPPGEFLDAITDLTLLSPEFDTLWHRLASAKDFEERVEVALEWVAAKGATSYQQEIALSGFLQEDLPSAKVSELATHYCYSSRQLSRKVNELFGMNTETLVSYKRYLDALNMVHYSGHSLTHIAHGAGYYDQSHFIREFKAYTAVTPKEYRKLQSPLQAHLYFEER
jgi:AraC-like DNA-binding protein